MSKFLKYILNSKKPHILRRGEASRSVKNFLYHSDFVTTASRVPDV